MAPKKAPKPGPKKKAAGTPAKTKAKAGGAAKKARPKAKAARRATAPKQPVILAVDNGSAYDFTFPKGVRQRVRIVGKHIALGATVRLSSHAVRWSKFRHEDVVPIPAPFLGSGYQVVLLRDTPSASTIRGTPADPDDSGDLTVTVTNEGAPPAIKDNEVLYP